jgi:CBS domain-containing protein
MTTVENILIEKGPDVIATQATTTVKDAACKMAQARVGSIVVEEYPKILGIFTERDLLVRVVAEGRDPAATPVSQVMSSPVATCAPEADIHQAARTMTDQHIRHLVVVDKEEIVGLVSVRDVLECILKQQAQPSAG